MQGHSQQLPHTLYSSYWLTVLWKPSFSLLSGRFLLFACFVCEEKKKGECVCMSATRLCLSDSPRQRKMLPALFIAALHINILLKAMCSGYFIFFFFCKVCREQSSVWYLHWLLTVVAEYTSCFTVWCTTVCVSLNIFTLKQMLIFKILPSIEQTVQNLKLGLGNIWISYQYHGMRQYIVIDFVLVYPDTIWVFSFLVLKAA